MERHSYIKDNFECPDIQAEYRNEYHNQLRMLEEIYGIDLTASKGIDLSHILFVRDLGHRVVSYAYALSYIKESALSGIHDSVENSIVLTEHDRRTFLLADVNSGLQTIISAWETDLQNHGEKVLEPYRPLFDARVQELNQLDEWYRQPAKNSPATKLGISVEGEIMLLSVFSDWTDNDAYEEHPLVPVVIEEMLHLSANMAPLTTDFGFSNSERITIEECAVVYYTSLFAKNLPVSAEIIEKFLAGSRREELVRWEKLISIIGTEEAAQIFFQGNFGESSSTWLNMVKEIVLDD